MPKLTAADLSKKDFSTMRGLVDDARRSGMNTTNAFTNKTDVGELGEKIGKHFDIKRQPVEHYRITDEQKSFLQKINRFQSIRQTLEKVTLQKQAEFKSLQAMWQALGKGMEILRNEAPKDFVHELPGMRFEEPEEERSGASGLSGAENGQPMGMGGGPTGE